MTELTARAKADLRKRTCSRCHQGHHELCTTPKTCAHYLCVVDEADPPADEPVTARRQADPDRPNPIQVSPSAGQLPASTTTPTPPRRAPQPLPVPTPPPTPAPRPRSPRMATEPVIDFAWETPPAIVRGPRPVALVLKDTGKLDELRERPGEWARLITYENKSSASTAVKKLRVELPEFEWEARSLKETGAKTRSRVYGRAPEATS